MKRSLRFLLAFGLLVMCAADVRAQQVTQAAAAIATPSGPFDAYNSRLVDEPPMRVAGPPLRYPAMLFRAGVEGEVLAQFVIDADGRAIKESVTVLESSNRGFEGAATEFIERAEYQPARHQGNAVPVMVEQAVRFRRTRR